MIDIEDQESVNHAIIEGLNMPIKGYIHAQKF